MASFSKLLKTANSSSIASNNVNSGIAIASVEPEVGIMTLETYDGLAYSGDDGWNHDKTKYRWFDEYEDENYSTVDDSKNIVLHEKQFNITQEENSQFIPFLMPRYYDGIDLSRFVISVHYTRSDGEHGVSDPVNVSYSNDQIRFSWLADPSVTGVAGAIEFEIHATGTITDINRQSYGYVWKTKSNKNLNVLQSLCGTNCGGAINIDDSWVQELVEKVAENIANQIADAQVGEQVAAAEAAATRAETAADNAESSAQTAVDNALVDYSTTAEMEAHVSQAIADADIEGKLTSYAKTEDVNTLVGDIGESENVVSYVDSSIQVVNDNLTNNYSTTVQTDQKISDALAGYATEEFVGQAIADADISEKLNDYYKKEETYNKKEVNDAVANVKVDLTGYATETFVTDKTDILNTSVDTNTKNISSLSETIGELQESVNSIDTSPRLTYDFDYNDIENPDVGENGFVVYEIENEGKENEVREIKKKFTIVGGSGGGSSSVLKIAYVTKSPVIRTVNDKVLITYNFSGTDSSGDNVTEGKYTWKIGSKIIATGIATNGENTFDATDFATTTSQKFTLSIVDDGGSLVTKSWTVQKVDVKVESNFIETNTYSGEVSFNYTPYGTVEKDIHFILDKKEIGVVKTSTSGIPTSYTIPSQTHGSHLLEVYMTATINNTLIESNHIYKDIIWIDPDSSIPVIGCATQTINVTQYDNVDIKYTVYDPNTETPRATWYIGDEVASEELLTEKDENGYYSYPYKANSEGTFVFTITCGEAKPKVITLNVEKLNINVAPVTAGLDFDFNPVGYSNASNKLWSYNDVTMTVSDNFDWVNGGYQRDENKDQYFCVKAGTHAVINYNLFADDPKRAGKEFKVIFRTKNIRKRNTSFLSCMDDGIGLDMKVENATLYESSGSLRSDYCEDTIIEYEFNINKHTDMMIVMSYEDGTPGKPYEYTEMSSFRQTSPKPITIGSEDCDIHIYRMKAYSTSLTDTDIKNNFIADARNSDEMISRYNRNRIYNDNGVLISTSASGDFSVDDLMKAAPDLRYIFLEVPQFTNDKDNKIDGCTVYFRYPNGTRPQDNWDCTGMRHRGQGTSSNLYGYSGRNIDLCMDRDESLFTWVDEEGNAVESSTITLTDTSVPTDYLTIKVNIASSENANNAQMARRFNEYQPFLRYARKKDSRVKDTMEFYNCVVFIRETSEDASVPHREFNDTNWHFYGIGNVGDSKKTDDTRVNNKRDPKEHVIEITDADKPLSAFPTGKDGHAICPVSEWKSGNTAYDILYSNEYVYDEEGAFESFGGTTYEFRYEMKDITDEQRQANIDTWRDLYTFIVTSSDKEFHEHLKDYFVVDSALYFYLFTERYTMVDNRAKNSFWHYGKVYISNEEALALGETEASYYIIDDEAASINNGYRYDLTFGYDMDTALGIDNTGDYVFSYGKEDTDYYIDGDPSSDYVFRVADSVFFCRLRDLFPSEMQAMFKDREEKNAWESESLINQWDNAQAQFPEELWRLDYERKYYRTYLGLSIDNSISKGVDKTFLIGKFFGRKKYARRAFEINQEMYFATKYFGNKAMNDENVFWIRGNIYAGNNENLKQNYSLTLVPYSDMYVCVQYSSTGTPIHKKAKAGETVYFENNSERMDFIYVYGASFIQEVGDLSRCYPGDNNFASAIRLQKLVIGSDDEGYENTFMKEIVVGNNPLLEHLDLRNVSGINTVIKVGASYNLKELYAEGTNAIGVEFANGGLLRTAHLPAITSLLMKNLNYVEDLSIDSYAKLEKLTVENCPNINTYSIINSSPRLKYIRLIGLNWDSTYQIEDGAIFDRLLTIGGLDSSSVETNLSVLTGTAHIAVMKEQQSYNYKNAWSELDITYNTLVEQFPVTFVNEDGTILDIQYVDKGGNAVDPISRADNPIATPTKASTISTDYTFAGWDIGFTGIFAARTIRATYSESTRSYTIKYVSKGVTMQTSKGLYGENVPYTGSIPVYTAEESAYSYYWFTGWDKSGIIDGDKTVEAVFDKCTYSEGYFDEKDISTLRPVEIYAMIQLGLERTYVESGDSIIMSFGRDYNYEDVRSEELISEKMIFNGTNHYDTGINLIDVDKDFVLAVDYKMDNTNIPNGVLMQCFRTDGSNGFKLFNNSSNEPKLTWGTTTETVGTKGFRDMLVLRHIKGEKGLHVYHSNLSGSSHTYVEFSLEKNTSGDASLVFGCKRADDGVYEDHGVGEINWAKVWYKDIGDVACRELVSWTHEELNLELGGFRWYTLSDGSGKVSSMTFLASHLLDGKRRLSASSSNVGGFGSTELNSFMNTRMYEAIDVQWRQLIKQVKVKSSAGGASTSIVETNCYLTIPAIYSLTGKSHSSNVYENENPKRFSHVSLSNQRIRKYVDGSADSYWTRSPNVEHSTYFCSISDTGEEANFNYPTSSKGILVELSI